MASIQERTNPSGDTVFRAQVRVKGYSTESATFDRKTDAKEWANRIESEMRAGRYRSVSEARRRTFGEMIDRYIQDVLPTKSEGTQGVQEPQYLWWKEVFGVLRP